MEIIIVVLLIAVLVLFYSRSTALHEEMWRLRQTIDQALRENAYLREEIREFHRRQAPPSPGVRTSPVSETPPLQPVRPPVPEAPPVIQTPQPEPETQVPRAAAVPVSQPSGIPEPVEEEGWMARWLRNNPDLEKFIGENLVNKIGIAILVLGIAFFVKYAIDKNWINEVGRVSIGLFCGAVLVGVAHYLRRTYRSFSSVLAGGGIAVFYFTIAFAFHQYHLVSQAAAFVLMVVITGFAVALSLLYNKLELAVIAAVGGFLTPFLVSSGEGNYVVLFTYLVILNAGLLNLSYFKRWPLINILSLFFTELIVAGWMIQTLVNNTPGVSYPLALLFVTLIYLIFLGMNMVHPLRREQPFTKTDFSILLILTASYYAAGMVLLQQVEGGNYQGLFTLVAGLLDLALAWWFFKRRGTDRNLLFLLIGLTLTFLSLAVPVQLDGHAITMFWSVETVVLFWLFQRSRIPLFRLSSALMGLLTLISLLMDWTDSSYREVSALPLIFTNIQGIVTNLVAVVAFVVYGKLLLREHEQEHYMEPFQNGWIRKTVQAIAVVILYLTCVFGVNLYFKALTSMEVPNVYHRLITEVYVAVLLVVWRQREGRAAAWQQLLAVGGCFIYYLASVNMITTVRNGVLAGTYSWPHLAAHWVSAAGMISLFYYAVHIIRRQPSLFNREIRALAWGISGSLVLFFSVEVLHVYTAINYQQDSLPQLESQYEKAVLTILWALCSFALMWLGMKHRNKTLRIVSLSLFSLALLKLFFFDIRDISEGGKIAAFILLGVLLLTISFMYQKLKQIIIDDVRQ